MDMSKIATGGTALCFGFLIALSAPAMGQGTEALPAITVPGAPTVVPGTYTTEDTTVAGQPGPLNDYTNTISKSALSSDQAASPANVTSYLYSESTTRGINGYEELLKPVTGVAANNFDQGPAVGYGIALRGFSERFSGRLSALHIDGVPINQTSHQLSNGYGDLFPLMPELVAGFTLTRGPFDVRAGAHAVGGSAFYTTADAPSSGVTAKNSGGSLDSQRGLGIFGFSGGAIKGYGSLVVEEMNGYRENSGWKQFNSFNKFNFPMLAGTGSVSVQIHGTESDSPGYINRDLIRAGTISDEEARNPTDGGESRLEKLVFNYKENSDNPFKITAYLSHNKIQRWSSFGGGDITIPQPGNITGRQNEQVEDRITLGGSMEKYQKWVTPEGIGFDMLVGAGIKADIVEQDQYRNTARLRLSQTEDLDFTQINPYGYGQINIKPFQWLKLTGGVRYDAMIYDITGFDDPARFATGPVDIEVQIHEYQPKAGVTITAMPGLDFFANYGVGFIPPAANGNELPNDPTLEAFINESEEIGVQYNSPDGMWHFLASYYYTTLSGSLQGNGQTLPPTILGASVRKGYDIEGRVRAINTGRTTLSFYASYSAQDASLTEPTAPGATHVQEVADFFIKYGFDLATRVGGEASPHRVRLTAGQVWEGPKALNNFDTLNTDTFSRVDAKLTYMNENWNGASAFAGLIVYPDGRLDEIAYRYNGSQIGVSAKPPVVVQFGVFIPFGFE